MLGTLEYVPALKAREAEIKALLRAPKSLDVTPLFELQRAGAGAVDDTGVPKRAKSSSTDASYFLDDIARLWDGPLYVDIQRVADVGQRATWWRLLDSLNSLAPVPAELIPVLILSDDAAVLSAANGVASQTNRVALRIDMWDVYRNPAALRGSTASLASGVGVDVTSVDVLLDWADGMDALGLDELVQATADVIDAFDGEHGKVVTLGTPNSEDFQQVGDWDPDRREWWLWLRLADAGRDVTYGDYALYPPADPVPAAPRYGHLRYSSGDKMHVHRRAIPPGGGGLGAAFAECCRYLVNQPHWLGAAFSKADRRLSDIAAKTDKESVPGKWRQLAAEHHFAVVTDQLSMPPPPPPSGTR